MMRSLIRAATVATLCLAAACRGPESRLDAPVRIADDTPAVGAGASTPFLASSADGTLWMSWMEQDADSVWMLRVAHRPANGSWSAPSTALRDSLLFANWADFPSVVVDARGRLVAHVLRRSSPGKYSYHVWVTTSADSGATWSAPQRLHRDSSATEHGFVALVPRADGSTAGAWLDGHATGGETGAMSLGFTVLDAALRVQRDTILDTRTCDCCQVAGAATSNGVLFAYRDRTAEEVRDISVVRFDGTSWHAPAVVHDDGWVTKACPVNGPALASRGDTVALVWFTNARDTAKVQLALSADAGASWAPSVRIDDGAPLGRVDVEYLADGAAMVTWMERTGKGKAEIRARYVRRDGSRSSAAVVAATSDARPAGFPRLTVVGGVVYVAWRELATPTRLHLARLEAPTAR
ncbi:MAG: exo-alpha-sialidase [Gemmatimonadetes bacterium]|nr:exo-alpha-sialidase [Gemmatimonadota bacterium]